MFAPTTPRDGVDAAGRPTGSGAVAGRAVLFAAVTVLAISRSGDAARAAVLISRAPRP